MTWGGGRGIIGGDGPEQEGAISEPVTDVHPAWRRVSRPVEGRIVGGVAAGLARSLGLRPVVVRFAFVALALAGGTGVLAYVLGWLLLPRAGADESIGEAALRHGQHARPVLALGMVVLGGLLLLRETGPWFDDRLVWPVVLAAMGLYVIWRQADDDDRRPLTRIARLPYGWSGRASVRRPASLARVLLGVVLVAAGVALFLATHGALGAARQGFLAIAAVVAGLVLVFGPWWARLVRDLAEERRERIRSQERAEMAAHLHDSVLQMLALIQRNVDDPKAVLTLARRQERELRTWLFGERPAAHGSLASAVEEVGAEVEALHRVAVEVVTVGDCPLDDRLSAVVLATREALVNAARCSGAPSVSLYAEAEPDAVTVYVRDRGVGFDASAVGPDRRGISESIVGRMRRHGGTAVVRSQPGQGTEVELRMWRDGGR